MRYTKSAFAALICALIVVPASVATADEQPSTTESTAPSAQGNPRSERAVAAEVCADALQYGETGHVVRAGETIASVKQFYSAECDENYAYVWVWDSFRNTVNDYDVSTALYNYQTDGNAVAQSWANTTQQEFWSAGIAWRGEYTSALGAVRAAGDPLASQGYSEQVCVDDELADA